MTTEVMSQEEWNAMNEVVGRYFEIMRTAPPLPSDLPRSEHFLRWMWAAGFYFGQWEEGPPPSEDVSTKELEDIAA